MVTRPPLPAGGDVATDDPQTPGLVLLVPRPCLHEPIVTPFSRLLLLLLHSKRVSFSTVSLIRTLVGVEQRGVLVPVAGELCCVHDGPSAVLVSVMGRRMLPP